MIRLDHNSDAETVLKTLIEATGDDMRRFAATR